MVGSIYRYFLAVFFTVTICFLLFTQRPFKVEQQSEIDQASLFGDFMKTPSGNATAQRGSRDDRLDGCRHVFLDLGSNVGIQVRKLYEPHLYPKSAMIKVYNEFFGHDRDLSEVCTVGFEPNPTHTPVLKTLEDAYRTCGWRVHFMTSTAVGDKDDQVEFFSDESRKNNEWGSTVLKVNTNAKFSMGSVQMVRLAKFINEVVAKRLIGDSKQQDMRPAVMMKMDIEGSEFEVLSDLLVSGSFQHIDAIAAEFHVGLFKSPVRREQMTTLKQFLHDLSTITQKFQVLDLDDESYGKSSMPLPQCNPS